MGGLGGVLWQDLVLKSVIESCQLFNRMSNDITQRRI